MRGGPLARHYDRVSPAHLGSALIIGRIILMFKRPHGDLVVDEQIVICRTGWINATETIVARWPNAICVIAPWEPRKIRRDIRRVRSFSHPTLRCRVLDGR